MDFGIFKPILTSFLMPPMAPLLLALLGLYLVFKKKRAGPGVVTVAVLMLWVFSCQGMGILLAANILPQYEPVTKAQLKSAVTVQPYASARACPEKTARMA